MARPEFLQRLCHAADVDVNIVAAFARMREHLQLDASVNEPSKVPADVVAAVAELIKERSQVLEVNGDGTRLRRKQVCVCVCAGTSSCLWHPWCSAGGRAVLCYAEPALCEQLQTAVCS